MKVDMTVAIVVLKLAHLKVLYLVETKVFWLVYLMVAL
jgi:hypothetical protein